jgi:hypothetical protein
MELDNDSKAVKRYLTEKCRNKLRRAISQSGVNGTVSTRHFRNDETVSPPISYILAGKMRKTIHILISA